MALSLNGWPVLQPGSDQLATMQVPGTTRRLTLRRDIAPLFLALAHDYDEWVKPIDAGPIDDGGYAYRQSRTGGGWSNHASATCIDLNYTGEGAQRPKNRAFWADKDHHARAVQLLTVYKVVTWGGNWGPDYWDPMHWEITRGIHLADVRARIRFLGITPLGVRTKNAAGHDIEPRD